MAKNSLKLMKETVMIIKILITEKHPFHPFIFGTIKFLFSSK